MAPSCHVRAGGQGPAVVLLHGYGETGDMWAPMAADLVARSPRHRSRPARPWPRPRSRPAASTSRPRRAMSPAFSPRLAWNASTSWRMTSATWSLSRSRRSSPSASRRLTLIDAPVPGVGPWEEILKNPLLWHFRFGGPDMERLVAGRERIYLDRFWNEFSADPADFGEAARNHYAELYALPGAMHSGFAQFAAFDQDAADNRAWLDSGARLPMPVLAVGGEKSFGLTMAAVMRAAATDVRRRRRARSAAIGSWKKIRKRRSLWSATSLPTAAAERAIGRAAGDIISPRAISMLERRALRVERANRRSDGFERTSPRRSGSRARRACSRARPSRRRAPREPKKKRPRRGGLATSARCCRWCWSACSSPWPASSPCCWPNAAPVRSPRTRSSC